MAGGPCRSGNSPTAPCWWAAVATSSTEQGVFHASAFTGHGFQLGPVVGGILAELVANGQSNLSFTPWCSDL
jgi:glycine/D-amino acid oxidase-like deaminating enzyme